METQHDNLTKAPPLSRGPMRVGEIVDYALRILGQVLATRVVTWLWFFTSLAAVTYHATTNFLEVERKPESTTELAAPLMIIACSGIALFALGYLLQASIIFSTAEIWNTGKANSSEVSSKLKFNLIFRQFGLDLVLRIRSGLLMLLLVIPGLVYAANRSLGTMILLLENRKSPDALERSKLLMTYHPGIRWWSFSAPLGRVSAIFFVAIFVAFVPSGLLGASTVGWEQLLTGESSAKHLTSLDLLVLLIAQLIASVAQMLGPIAFTGFYFDLRTRIFADDLFEKLVAIEAENGA